MYYLATYDTFDEKSEKREVYLSSANKLNYIFECLNKNNIKCNIISCSSSQKKLFIWKKKKTLSDNLILSLPPSVLEKNIIFKIINRILIKSYVLFQLLKIKKKEILFIYHSLYYIDLIRIAKKIKKFKLVIEAEEIYGNVIHNEKMILREMNFFKLADGYLFPTILLNEKINLYNKPFLIIHGTYKVEPIITKRFNDGKVHCVYAGTLNQEKGGAFIAVSIASYLPSNYIIHILGDGNKLEKEKLITLINDINNKQKCQVSYDGTLSGYEYIKFLQKCSIGLSTQSSIGLFNDTSFPSKLLSYMGNGLEVISARLPVVESSAIGNNVHYYDVQDPKIIADLIKQMGYMNNYDNRKIVSELDKVFTNDILLFLNKFR